MNINSLTLIRMMFERYSYEKLIACMKTLVTIIKLLILRNFLVLNESHNILLLVSSTSKIVTPLCFDSCYDEPWYDEEPYLVLPRAHSLPKVPGLRPAASYAQR